MANHKSAKKRTRQNQKRTQRRASIKSSVKTFEKKLRLALKSNNPKEAAEGLAMFSKHIAKAVQKRVFHKNKGARKISQLAKRVYSLSKSSS